MSVKIDETIKNSHQIMVFPFVSDRSLIVGSRSSFPRSLESPTREMWLIVTLYATCLADCLNALNIIPGKACGLQTADAKNTVLTAGMRTDVYVRSHYKRHEKFSLFLAQSLKIHNKQWSW